MKGGLYSSRRFQSSRSCDRCPRRYFGLKFDYDNDAGLARVGEMPGRIMNYEIWKYRGKIDIRMNPKGGKIYLRRVLKQDDHDGIVC